VQSTKELFVVKIDYKNFTRFLTIKELNHKQVKWAEMLVKYYFKIKHVKKLNNVRADIFNRKEKLQNSNKMSGALFKLKENGKI